MPALVSRRDFFRNINKCYWTNHKHTFDNQTRCLLRPSTAHVCVLNGFSFSLCSAAVWAVNTFSGHTHTHTHTHRGKHNCIISVFLPLHLSEATNIYISSIIFKHVDARAVWMYSVCVCVILSAFTDSLESLCDHQPLPQQFVQRNPRKSQTTQISA